MHLVSTDLLNVSTPLTIIELQLPSTCVAVMQFSWFSLHLHKEIEKAFRRLALEQHPDKVGWTFGVEGTIACFEHPR